MTSQDTSVDKRLLHKIQARLAMVSAYFKAQQSARTERVDPEREDPPPPFLFQG